jgi:hypothetical protein
MTVGAHRKAHEIHLCDINGFHIYKQVSSRLKVGFQISAFHC